MPMFSRNRHPARPVLLEDLESRMLLSASHAAAALTQWVTGFTTISISNHVSAVASPIAVVDGTVTPAATSPPGNAFTPAQIRQAYGFNQVSFGSVQGNGTGQTIAIIDAFDDPDIASDLTAFDTQFGLPAPPSFKKVSETGTSSLPAAATPSMSSSWSIEESLDVEWAHAAAPGASIILVEGNSDSYDDLIAAGANWARQQTGISVISMSFGGGEFGGERQYDQYFQTPNGHAGVTFVASTGDTQTGEYPAMSPDVLAVGGTTLTLDSNNNYVSESGWSQGGGGISTFEIQPSYQKGIVTQSNQVRTIPDVSMVADPNTGVAVYDSYDFGSSPWVTIGGTSLAAPLWAGVIAVADQGRITAGLATLDGATGTLPKLYNLPTSDFHDITTGNDGNAAAVGYDLVTGIGSPIVNDVVYGLMGNSSIAGTVFQDNNSDGVQDGTDTAIAGATVYLDTNNNGVLDTGTTTTTTSSTALAIPDLSSATSSLRVASTGTISNLTITINITHPRDSDLTAYLMGPAGTQIELFSSVGGTGKNFTSTTFSDQATTNISAGTAPFTGTFQTQNGLLADFDGQSANGIWKLMLTDGANGDTGTLQSWSLNVTTGPLDVYSTTTDANGHYSFPALPKGVSYVVREVPPLNEVQTTPASNAGIVTSPLFAAITGQNFTNFPTLFTTTSDTSSYYVSVDPSDTFLQISLGTTASTTPAYQIPLSALPLLTFNLLGQNNVLVIDFVNGSPLPAGNITVNATAGSNDELRVLGQNASQLFTLTDTQDAPATGGPAIVYNNLPTLTLYNATTNYTGSLNTLQNLNLDTNETFNWN
jgi:subtilisin-like proprotein convertase family protein